MTAAADRDALARVSGRIGEALMLVAIFLAPYLTWRIDREILFTVSDALFAIAVLFLLVAGRLTLRPFGGLSPLWFGAVAIMLLGLLIASLVHDLPGRWTIVAGQYLVAYAVLPLALCMPDETTLRRRLAALVLGVAAMEAVGVTLFWWLGGSYLAASRISPDLITGLHRLGGFMADANWNAAMVAMTMPALLYLGLMRSLGPIAITFGLGVLVYGLVLSGSFSGFAAALLGALVFATVAGGRQVARPLAIVAALVAAAWLAGLQLPAAFQTRVAGAIESGDLAQAGTFVGRWELIVEAWDLVDRHGTIGLGADRFRAVSTHAAPVHNMPLLIWAEGGLLGLAGWVVLSILPLVAAFAALRADRRKAALCAATAAPFVVFSLTSAHLYARCWTVPLLLGVAMALTARKVRPVIPPGVRHPGRRLHRSASPSTAGLS